MGKGSVTTGFWYRLGAHQILCLGCIDRLFEIKARNKTIWQAQLSEPPEGNEPETGLLGTVSDMAAVAGSGDTNASITFGGRLSGPRQSMDVDLTLADDSVVSVTILAVSYDADNDITTWIVTPQNTAFSSQEVTIRERDRPVGVEDLIGSDGTGGRFRIDKPEIFGGEDRQGGVQGEFDLERGKPGQTANDYLTKVIKRDFPDITMPAFRGLTAIVMRQPRLTANNPSIPNFEYRISRTQKTDDCADIWYQEKAAIFVSQPGTTSDPFLRGLSEDGNDRFRHLQSNDGIDYAPKTKDFDDSGWKISDLPIGARDTSSGLVFPDFPNMPGIDTLRVFPGHDWVRKKIPPQAGTITVGIAVGEGAAGGLWIDGEFQPLELNSPESGETQAETIELPPSDEERQLAAVAAYGTGFIVDQNRLFFHVWFDQPGDVGEPDMNPAHMIREALTSTVWGRGIPDSQMGESFRTAADTLFAEGLGLSAIYERDQSVNRFIANILRHIDGTVYVDRRTGLIELKLIRDDYDIASIPTFTDGDIVDLSDFGRRDAGELADTVTVRFTDRTTDQRGAVTVNDIAARQSAGIARRSVTQNFEMLRWRSLASRLAERELRALSAQLYSGPVKLNRKADVLEPGFPFRIQSARWGIDVVARVTEIDLGDGRDNAITLKAVEDVFSLQSIAAVGGDLLPPPSTQRKPKSAERRAVLEAPYWALVQRFGHDLVDDTLDEATDDGRVMATGEDRGGGGGRIEIWTQPNANWREDGAADFAPAATLDADLSDVPTDRAVAVRDWSGLEDAAIGDLIAVNDELMRLDGVGASSVSLGRGVLDTVPRAHKAGDALVVLSGNVGLAGEEIAAGLSLDVKLRPRSGGNLLALASAPTDTVTGDSRAIRPLPPGDLQFNGSYTPDPADLVAAPVTLTWAHRSRTAQTTADLDAYMAGDIGPEAGVSYVLEARWVDAAGTVTASPALSTNLGTVTTHDVALADLPTAPGSAVAVEITVRASRDADGTTYLDRGYRGRVFSIADTGTGYGRRYGMAWGR